MILIPSFNKFHIALEANYDCITCLKLGNSQESIFGLVKKVVVVLLDKIFYIFEPLESISRIEYLDTINCKLAKM